MAEKLHQNCLPEETRKHRRRILKISEVVHGGLSDEERYGSVDRVLVLCGEDKTMQVEFRRRMIDQNPPQAVKLIGEADHMAMLSRPHERCQCFEDIAKNYC
ncbi:hypothetical protein EUGRSUZ_I00997 [Eucalyptus grandis]|uniref:Uncharacterized protein n=2 Tax=Eucalyptus grandis TaxID=71139 RepID=A0ACC3JFB7_EUCGR|nr:hypothetical protein EUGRSUZ_I00997 [Eucalyptus grandis]